MNEQEVKGAGQSVAGKAQAAVGQLTGDKSTEARGQLRDAEGFAKRVYGQAVDAAGELGETASGLAKQAADVGSDYYKQGNKAVANAMREQPIGALLVAGAVGFSLALLLNRQQPPRRRPRWSDLRDFRY